MPKRARTSRINLACPTGATAGGDDHAFIPDHAGEPEVRVPGFAAAEPDRCGAGVRFASKTVDVPCLGADPGPPCNLTGAWQLVVGEIDLGVHRKNGVRSAS